MRQYTVENGRQDEVSLARNVLGPVPAQRKPGLSFPDRNVFADLPLGLRIYDSTHEVAPIGRVTHGDEPGTLYHTLQQFIIDSLVRDQSRARRALLSLESE